MADVNINIFTNKIYKQGASTVVPGFIQGEEPTPINPSGSGGASEFVPYVGATENFDLGEFGMSAGFFKLDTTPTNTPTDQGTFYWDEDDNTVDIILNGYIMKVGEDLFYPVKNQTGSSIAKGTNVGFAGTLGSSGRLLITPYLANGANPTSRYMGVTAETIGPGEDGKVLWFGRIRKINTNAYNEGDILYASTTSAGGFQTTLPVAPNNIVEVCAVVTKSVNNGVIFVRPQFLASGTIGGSIASGQVAFGTGVNTIGGDSTFNFDSATNILQVETLSLGDSVTATRLNSGSGPRVWSMIDTNGVARIWRFTSASNLHPSLEFIWGNNNDAASALNRRWDIYLNSNDSFSFRKRTGTANVNYLTIDTNGSVSLFDSGNLIIGTTTGTKIGTATDQKLSFWNATPIVQPTTGIAESAFVENSGGVNVNDDSTFDGYTLRQVVKALRDAGLLA